MIKKIIFIGDHYRGHQDKNVRILFELITPVFFDTNIEVEILCNTHKYANEEKWIESLSDTGISALSDYDLSDVAIIGFEINKLDKTFLIRNSIPWVNVEIHPLRFLEDLYFSITSSFEFDINILAPKDSYIKFTANTIKLNNLNSNFEIKNNSLLIIGQTPNDKSIYFDGKFKSLLDYLDELDDLCENHKNIYYRPHPNLTNHEIDKEIIKRYNASLLSLENYYDIISNDNIKTVCGISSSSLHEGKYFGKEIIFLEERIKVFSKPIALKSLLECSEFWFEKLLSMKCASKPTIDFLLFNNMCRSYYGAWSYETPMSKLENKIVDLQEKVSKAEEKASEAEEKASEAEAKASEAEAKASEAEAKASEAEAKASEAEAKASEAEAKASKAEAEARASAAEAKASEARASAAEAQSNSLVHDYHLLVNSKSWRITKPLRLSVKFMRCFVTAIKHWITFSPTSSSPSSSPRRILKQLLLALKQRINTNPKLKMKLRSLLNHFPRLKAILKRVGQVSYKPTTPIYKNKRSVSTIENLYKQKDIRGLHVNEIMNKIKIEIKNRESSGEYEKER